MGKNKKIKILQLYFIILFIFQSFSSIVSFATSESIVFLSYNNKIVKIGEEVEVYVNIENAKTSAFTSYINFDETKLEYISGPENTNIIKNRIINVWYDETGGNKEKQGKIAKYKFKIKEEGIANLTINGEFYDRTGQHINATFKDLQIESTENQIEDKNKKETMINVDNEKEANSELSNTNLETLAIENVLLYPPFDSNITNYNVEISEDVENINLLAIPENEKAKTEVIGKENLKEGKNKITVTVIAEDGVNKKVYVINAYKRNQKEEQEETAYQEMQQENLEHAYEIEQEKKFDEKNNITPNSEVKKEKFYIILIILAIILIILIMRKLKNRNKIK